MRAQALLSKLKSSLIGGTRIGSYATQTSDSTSKKLAQARETIARKNEELEKARRQMVRKDQELAELRAASGGSSVETRAGGLRPENIIWVFGTAKTGSTWIGSMMGDPRGHYAWREPNVGDLFGSHYYKRSEGKYSTRKYQHWEHFWILGGGHRGAWVNSIRSFVLGQIEVPRDDGDGLPGDQRTARLRRHPLLMEALPESRLVFLVRDPRDVASSALNTRKKGSRVYERHRDRLGGEDTLGASHRTTS